MENRKWENSGHIEGVIGFQGSKLHRFFLQLVKLWLRQKSRFLLTVN